MDWAKAIDLNGTALTNIVAALFAMLGVRDGVVVGRIPRALHSAVLAILRPAESAVRRLIVIAARGLQAKLPPARAMPAGLVLVRKEGGRAAFRLFDKRQRFGHFRRAGVAAAPVPRIRSFDAGPLLLAVAGPAAAAAREPGGPVNAERLCRRLRALSQALKNLPREARRLARWRARRERLARPKFTSPLRPGAPPGCRKRPVHPVDEVLRECHNLAHDALLPDTS